MYGFKKLQLQREVRNGKVVFLLFCNFTNTQKNNFTIPQFYNSLKHQ